MTRKERLLKVAALTDQAVALIADMHRHWWRVLRNRRLRREVVALLAECDAELDAIAEAKAKYGHSVLVGPGDPAMAALPKLPPGAIGWQVYGG